MKQFSTFNIAYISKFVVDFNYDVQTRIHCYFNGSFCSVKAGRTSHFYSFFSVNILARVDFWYDNLSLWLGRSTERVVRKTLRN